MLAIAQPRSPAAGRNLPLRVASDRTPASCSGPRRRVPTWRRRNRCRAPRKNSAARFGSGRPIGPSPRRRSAVQRLGQAAGRAGRPESRFACAPLGMPKRSSTAPARQKPVPPSARSETVAVARRRRREGGRRGRPGSRSKMSRGSVPRARRCGRRSEFLGLRLQAPRGAAAGVLERQWGRGERASAVRRSPYPSLHARPTDTMSPRRRVRPAAPAGREA